MFIFELVAVIAAAGAGLLLISGFVSAADSAPALGALSATAAAIAIIPYCFVGILQRRATRGLLERLNRLADEDQDQPS